MFKVVANLDMSTPLSGVAEMARKAEALGFDQISIPDATHDGLVAAAIAATATTRIEIANSALVCFPRSPMTTAVAAWDLQELSGGRYRLGLGSLVAPNIIQKYSTPWHPPVPRMREYVEAMTAIFRSWQYGETLAYKGEFYQFTRQQKYMAPPPIKHPDIPVHLAAVGPNMAALAGEIADAVSLHPSNTSSRFITECVQEDLARGARRVGRAASDIDIVVNPLIATGSTAGDIESSRAVQKQLLAVILSTPNYWRSLELFGWSEVGPALRQLTREGSWDRMENLITDEILEAFVITARMQDVPDVLAEQYRGIASCIAVNFNYSNLPDDYFRYLIAALKA